MLTNGKDVSEGPLGTLMFQSINVTGEHTMKTNVVVAVFNVESEGYQALTELKNAVSGDKFFVSAAALVKKDEDSCQYLDGFDTGLYTADDAIAGGLLGMMLGVIGGPLGLLIGGSYGALVGMVIDDEDAVLGVSMLDQIADKLDDGMVALVALADEAAEEELDAKLSGFDVVIARFDADKVADEVDRAYEKQAEMARLARMELRKETKDQARADIQESVKQGQENFRYDMAVTKGTIKELKAERKARIQEKREKRIEELEENSEILKQNFTK